MWVCVEQACYFLETPGEYELAVYLEFTNALLMTMQAQRIQCRWLCEVSRGGGGRNWGPALTCSDLPSHSTHSPLLCRVAEKC